MIRLTFELSMIANRTKHCGDFDPMNDVEPILILPCSTPDFEAGIWGAAIDAERDWTDIEREYLRRNDGIRESLMDWAIYNYSDGCWTDANLAFLSPYLKEYQP